jgi:hypothetical protein
MCILKPGTSHPITKAPDPHKVYKTKGYVPKPTKHDPITGKRLHIPKQRDKLIETGQTTLQFQESQKTTTSTQPAQDPRSDIPSSTRQTGHSTSANGAQEPRGSARTTRSTETSNSPDDDPPQATEDRPEDHRTRARHTTTTLYNPHTDYNNNTGDKKTVEAQPPERDGVG